MKLYAIANWNELYENNRSRRVQDATHVPVPNRFDGEGYGRVMAHPDAAIIFSAWILLLQLASRSDPRGTLRRGNGQPHDAASMAIKCRCPQQWFELALPFLVEQTDWVTVSDDTMTPPCSDVDVTPTYPRPDADLTPERPNGMPTLKVVLAWAAMGGCPEDEATKFWNHFESTGWKDRNGNSIVNARAKLASWVADVRSRAAEKKTTRLSPAELVLRQKELERVEKEIESMRKNRPERPAASDADIEAWRTTIRALKARREELLRILGMSA